MSAPDPVLRSPTATDEAALIRSLRDGDEEAFVSLVEAHTPAMLRVARLYVHTQAVADEVVQETWLAVLGALEGFEGRSSLRTWIFAILGNVARRRGEREQRSVPVESLDDSRPSPGRDRFFPAEHPRWGGMWTTLVDDWNGIPDAELLGAEARRKLQETLKTLPTRYAVVFVLRDVEGWSGSEVCGLLGLTPENQRVLLHRARTRIRAALEDYFEQGRG